LRMQKRTRQSAPRYNPYSSSGPSRGPSALLDDQFGQQHFQAAQNFGQAAQNFGQAAQMAAFLTAAGYDAAYVAPANAAAQAASSMGGGASMGGMGGPLLEEKQQDELKPGQYKVSKQSITKSVAGKIASDVRGGVFPQLIAKGEAVSVATKAIALACTYLINDGVMLSCSPYHKNDGDNVTGRTVVLVLKKVPITPLEVGPTIVKVAKTSKTAGVAGSIAANIRKSDSVTMQALGPPCILIAVDALVVARRMLRDSRLDIGFTPKFVQLPNATEKGASALQFHVSVVKRPAAAP